MENSDRFIPVRSSMDVELCHYSMLNDEDQENKNPNVNKEVDYNNRLAESLFDMNKNNTNKILSFQKKAPAKKPNRQNDMKILYSYNRGKSMVNKKTKKQTRHISQVPKKILDAPNLIDDYYLNLMDWSRSNILAIGLEQDVYLWNATTSNIEHIPALTEDPNQYVTSVNFTADGQFLAIGTSDCQVQIWDIQTQKKMRNMNGHSGRVGALAWNQHILSSGSADATIVNHDVRQKVHHISTFVGHEEEICGLKWSLNGMQLASGGNDNKLNIYEESDISNPNINGIKPVFSFEDHQAAVRALSWAPFQNNLLASGGGTADKCIKFWNTKTGSLLNSIDTCSQVCSLQWSKHSKELVSSHGFAKNQLIVWKYPSLTPICELTGHTSRVLHMSLSPDGTTIASAAGDETLRFWEIFEAPIVKKHKANNPLSSSKFQSVHRFR